MSTPKESFAQNAAAGDSVIPPQGVRDTGYAETFVPAQEFNGLLGSRGLFFVDPATGYDAMSAGQVCSCPAIDPTVAPLESVDSYTGTIVAPLFATGRYLVVEGASNTILVIDPKDMSLVNTITTAGSGTLGAVDGERAYWYTGASLYCYELVSGTQVWTQALSHSVLHTDGANVYTVSGANVYARSCTDGTAVWGPYDHGANVYHGYSNGRQLFLSGAVGTSSQTLRAIEAATGKDANNDGGIGTSTEAWVWDAAPSGYVAHAAINRHRLAFDGESLYVSGDSSGTTERYKINAHTGTTIASRSASDTCEVVTDGQHVYFHTSLGVLTPVDRLTLAQQYGEHDVTGLSHSLATDGHWVYVSNATTVFKLRPVVSRSRDFYRREPGTDLYVEWPNLVMHPLQSI